MAAGRAMSNLSRHQESLLFQAILSRHQAHLRSLDTLSRHQETLGIPAILSRRQVSLRSQGNLSGAQESLEFQENLVGQGILSGSRRSWPRSTGVGNRARSPLCKR